MLYTLNLDENDYILSIGHGPYDNSELDLETLDVKHINAYRFIDNQAVLDQEKLNAMIAEEERIGKALEIEELEKNLNSTDYIVARAFEDVMALTNPLTWVADVIKIMIKYSTQYAETLANRKIWRERIEELRK